MTEKTANAVFFMGFKGNCIDLHSINQGLIYKAIASTNPVLWFALNVSHSCFPGSFFLLFVVFSLLGASIGKSFILLRMF